MTHLAARTHAGSDGNHVVSVLPAGSDSAPPSWHLGDPPHLLSISSICSHLCCLLHSLLRLSTTQQRCSLTIHGAPPLTPHIQ